MQRLNALFLHGAGAWGGQWLIWQRVFAAAGWRTQAPDRRPVAAGTSATRLADHVDQTVDAMVDAGDGTVVIGASVGGLLAVLATQQALAMRSVSPMGSVFRPAALVLVNPLPPAPWAAQLAAFAFEPEAALVPWHSQGRFESTQRALPKAGFTDQHLAFRHWRDESAALLREAYAGVLSAAPSCPVLVIASDEDAAVPPKLIAAMAGSWDASLVRVPGGHIDPVMGHSAAASATATLAWLRTRLK